MRKVLLAGLLALCAAPLSARAADPYDINVILPLTGGGAFAGKGQQDNLGALEAVMNKEGGIDGRPVHFVYHDDQTTPQVAVQLASDIIADHPAVFIGSSLVALCNAIAPLTKDGPVQYCMSPGFHPAPGSFGFSVSSSSYDQMATVLRYYHLKGWNKIAVLTPTDATGQDADKALATILALPEFKDMQKVEYQHFNTSDLSVAAQMERIKASGAQAVIAWTTGTPLATVLKAAIQADLDIPITPSSGNQTFAQMAQYESFLPKGFLLPSAIFPEHDGVLTLDPRVEKAQHDMYAILKERNLRADNMTATSWDAGLIVVAALRKLGPKATDVQVRDYIDNITDFAGIGGIYNFKENTERGLGDNRSTVVSYDAKDKRWVWMAKPGGEPLK
jgi:branched-chain amino acid transport system substrate-binding protein